MVKRDNIPTSLTGWGFWIDVSGKTPKFIKVETHKHVVPVIQEIKDRDLQDNWNNSFKDNDLNALFLYAMNVFQWVHIRNDKALVVQGTKSSLQKVFSNSKLLKLFSDWIATTSKTKEFGIGVVDDSYDYSHDSDNLYPVHPDDENFLRYTFTIMQPYRAAQAKGELREMFDLIDMQLPSLLSKVLHSDLDEVKWYDTTKKQMVETVAINENSYSQMYQDGLVRLHFEGDRITLTGHERFVDETLLKLSGELVCEKLILEMPNKTLELNENSRKEYWLNLDKKYNSRPIINEGKLPDISKFQVESLSINDYGYWYDSKTKKFYKLDGKVVSHENFIFHYGDQLGCDTAKIEKWKKRSAASSAEDYAISLYMIGYKAGLVRIVNCSAHCTTINFDGSKNSIKRMWDDNREDLRRFFASGQMAFERLYIDFSAGERRMKGTWTVIERDGLTTGRWVDRLATELDVLLVNIPSVVEDKIRKTLQYIKEDSITSEPLFIEGDYNMNYPLTLDYLNSNNTVTPELIKNAKEGGCLIWANDGKRWIGIRGRGPFLCAIANKSIKEIRELHAAKNHDAMGDTREAAVQDAVKWAENILIQSKLHKNKRINESFDKSLPFQVIADDVNMKAYSFAVPTDKEFRDASDQYKKAKNIPYYVEFTKRKYVDNDQWDVVFQIDRAFMAANKEIFMPDGDYKPYDPTGTGNVQTVLSTVQSIFEDFLREEQPDILTFSSKEENRTSFYYRFFVKRNFQRFLDVGYKISDTPSSNYLPGSYTFFIRKVKSTK